MEILFGLLMIYVFYFTLTESKRQRKRLLRAGMDEIDIMSGEQFEKYLATLFKHLGYQVVMTKQSGDYGADLVLQKDQMTRIVVQCKRYSGKVSVRAIQKVVGAKAYYNAN